MTQTIDVENELLEKCLSLFMTYGVKSVTMQDIARSTGVSKKTLYDQFENKQSLVNAVIGYDFDYMKANLEKIREESGNAIDELLLLSEFIVKRFGNSNPCLMYDLKKYYTQSWELFMSKKMDFVYGHIHNNLTRGIEEELYRTDMDNEVISRIYFSKMDAFFDERLFPSPQFHFVQLHREYMIYHLRGIASKKGHEILDISLSLKNRYS